MTYLHTICQQGTMVSEENLKEAAKNYTSGIKTNLKKFGITSIVNITFLCLGSLLFFYIEHCYDVVPQPGNCFESAKTLHHICSNIKITRSQCYTLRQPRSIDYNLKWIELVH